MCREEFSPPKGEWVSAGDGRWETNEDSNGYNWIPERTWVSISVNVQCICSGNDSLCEHCYGIGTVSCA